MDKKPQDVTFQSADGTVIYGCFRRPPGDGPFPAVIFIHGGFGNNREYTRELLDWSIAESLLREGFIVFSTDYRIEPEEKAIDDVVACFEYVSERSFVDRDKIIYFGDSHGSFLEMMAALRTDPFAIIHCWGVANFAEWYEHIKHSQSPGLQKIAKMFKESFGGTPEEVPEAYRQASVVTHVDKLKCPVLIIHGEKDDEVPVTQAYQLAESLKRLRHEYKLKIFKDEGHGIRDPEAKKEMDAVVFEFLKRKRRTPMKKFFIFLFTALFLLLSFEILFGEKIEKRLESELVPVIKKDMERLNVPGLAVAVIADGKIIWEKGFGYADREKKIPATPQTIYRVGSISKLFNAVAIMQQHERGKLDIDSELKKYLPFMSFDNPFEKPAVISLRHFLSHRADIARECPVGHYFDSSESSLEETVRSMVGTRLIYPPGSRTKYSNVGIGIAGHILEKVTQKDFAAYQKECILKPLSMSSSSFLYEDFIKEKASKGYMRDLDGKQWEAPHFKFGYLPAANLYSSVIDMSKFIDFILEEGKPLLKNETFKEMVTVQFVDKKAESGFGLGFFVSKIHNFRSIGHSGAVYGFSSNLLAIPEKRLGIIVLNNLDGANGFNYKIVVTALGIAVEEKTDKKILGIPAPYETTLSELKKYEGKYERETVPAWLKMINKRLYYEAYGIRKQLAQVAKGEFITDDLVGYGERVEIIEEEGKVKAIEINNKVFEKAKKIKKAKLLKWKKLTGDYGPDYNIMKVYEKEGKLTVLIEWFYEYPLQHLEGLRFQFPDYGLYHGEEIIFKEKDKRIIGADVALVDFKRRK